MVDIFNTFLQNSSQNWTWEKLRFQKSQLNSLILYFRMLPKRIQIYTCAHQFLPSSWQNPVRNYPILSDSGSFTFTLSQTTLLELSFTSLGGECPLKFYQNQIKQSKTNSFTAGLFGILSEFLRRGYLYAIFSKLFDLTQTSCMLRIMASQRLVLKLINQGQYQQSTKSQDLCNIKETLKLLH